MTKSSRYRPFFLFTIIALVLLPPLRAAQGQLPVFSDERPEAVTFSIPLEQVESAAVSEDGRLGIILDSEGRDRLSEITRENLWKPIQIVIAGHRVMRFTVVVEIDSGVLRVEEPEETLLKALEPFL
jgi:hypothetical protein